MRYLYIIPARGGSKGIPGKNIKPLKGKSIVARAIEQALGAGAKPEDICVTTDDPQIRREAQACGIDVPFLRDASLATDTAGSREVMLDALDRFERLRGKYDAIILLQPTSPLRTSGDIAGARARFSSDCDMVVSVCEATTNPYYNAFETSADGTLRISKGEGLFTRRQDAPKVWEYNGAVYVINPRSLREMPMGAFPRRIPYEMPRNRSVDLDTPLDWLMAEHLLADD